MVYGKKKAGCCGMKLSMMSGSMTWHGYTPEDAARLGGKLGLDGIEWVTDCGRTAAELKKYSDDAGLPVACYTFFSPGAERGCGRRIGGYPGRG